MEAILGSLVAPIGAMLAQLDINGFVTSDTFLSALAQFISSILIQLFNALVFGGSMVLGA